MLPAVSSESRLTRLQPATTLAEIAQTLVAEPLETIADQKTFYREEIQKQRGIDRIGRIRLGLQEAVAANRPYKAFVMGHPGVGKTTELWRLIQGMNGQFRPLYLSVTDELNPGTLRFYDVQYNGAMWMGVHPLVVDLLIEFGKLDAGSPGGSLL